MAAGGGTVSYNPGSFYAENSDTGNLISFLQGVTGSDVIDETGLPGSYRIKMEWEAGNKAAMDAALKESLGMTLEPAERPVEVLEVKPAAL